MNTTLDKTLCHQYPSLLRYGISDNNRFYFECGDGWFDIIHTTLSLVDKHSILRENPVTITQVKEKFGTLRIYCRDGDEFTNFVTGIAELISGFICEACGNTGQIQTTTGWTQVRCNVHKTTSAENTNGALQTSIKYRLILETTINLVLNFIYRNTQWAMNWLTEPLLALNHDKPYELLGTYDGCFAVKTTINRLEHGVFF
jgi:hypothetical protein